MKQIDPELHRKLTAILRDGGIPDAELEAQWILEDIPDAENALEIARRRAKHEPLQYLLGKWEFYGLTIYVGEGVLIPRADTETLVEAVLSRVPNRSGQVIMDLCTGSGCIALALANYLEDTRIRGFDLSAKAWEYARKNLAYHGFYNVQFYCANVLDKTTAAQYHDLAAIVCNPPYLTAEDMQQLQEEVKYEPASALEGGADGLRFYREITRLWRDSLQEGGLLAYEVGIGQADDVAAILKQNGFSEIEKIRDYNGVERVVCGRNNQL